jgi:hypothetical protein
MSLMHKTRRKMNAIYLYGGIMCCVCVYPSLAISNDGLIACTQEAKLCPDGSGVGRTGPNCEFAPCPNEKPVKPDGRCTKDARRCPDGSYVGRSGPNCEFDCTKSAKPPPPDHGPYLPEAK